MKRGILFLLPFILVAVTWFSCHSVKQVPLTGNAFFGNDTIRQDMEGYNIYIHEGENTWHFVNPRVIDSESIKGRLERVDNKTAEEIKDPGSRKKRKKHQLDVNIYTKTPPSPAFASNEEKMASDEVLVKKEQVDKVLMYARDPKEDTGKIILIILAIVAVLALAVLVIVVGNAANDSSNGSGNSSNDSGQGSNESSNGSNASSEGSNNSSNASGCYIATMVYGSYDAPQVMVLRNFRDERLLNSRLGRRFVKFYYKHSPGLVEKWKNRKVLNRFIRSVLDQFVRILG